MARARVLEVGMPTVVFPFRHLVLATDECRHLPRQIARPRIERPRWGKLSREIGMDGRAETPGPDRQDHVTGGDVIEVALDQVPPRHVGGAIAKLSKFEKTLSKSREWDYRFAARQGTREAALDELSGLDSAFLSWENATTHIYVGLVSVFDSATLGVVRTGSR